MNKDIERIWEQLKTQRDELRVRACLARAELREEWEVVEEKWHKAEKNLAHLRDDAIESTTETKQAVHIIMEEISSTYKRIKDRLDN